MANQWYYTRNGQQMGPVAFELLKQLASSGQLAPTDLVWMEGMAQWTEAGKVADLFYADSTPASIAQPMPGYTQPLSYQPVSGYGTPPPNYLWQAIACTVCCCMPFGVAAIVFAAQVNSKYSGGDFQGAVQSSESAKKFCWLAFGLGIAANIIFIGLQIVAATAGR